MTIGNVPSVTTHQPLLAWLRVVCRVAAISMVVLMIVMVIVMNALVVTRYLFAYSAPWTEEVTRYAMVWLVMLGAGVLALFDDHITLNMAVDLLPARLRAWQRLLVQLFVFTIALLIFWKGMLFAQGMGEVIAPALQVSMIYAAVSVPIGGALIAIFSAIRVIVEIAGIFGGKPPTLPDQFEFMDNSFKPAEDSTEIGASAAGSAAQGSAR
jgi:TRAP-type C4-dicarboxylate transport system permease small subunit